MATKPVGACAVDSTTADVDAVRGDGLHAVPTELVVAHPADERHVGAESGGGSGDVRALSSRRGQISLGDERCLTRRLLDAEQVEVHGETADDDDPAHDTSDLLTATGRSSRTRSPGRATTASNPSRFSTASTSAADESPSPWLT